MAEGLVQLQVKVELDPTQAVPQSEAANYFAMATIGTEVQLLVGTVPLHSMVQGQVVHPEITHRFLLSPFAFGQLVKQVDGIRNLVVDSGAIFGKS